MSPPLWNEAETAIPTRICFRPASTAAVYTEKFGPSGSYGILLWPLEGNVSLDGVLNFGITVCASAHFKLCQPR